jgi:hypothetical protein
VSPHKTLGQCVETIESAYEFMLAYAAQGRAQEATNTAPAIRGVLTDLDGALGGIETAIVSSGSQPVQSFIDLLISDAVRARAAVAIVLATPNISSLLVDNLNATVHLRTLLTSMFLVDEALKQMRAPANA